MARTAAVLAWVGALAACGGGSAGYVVDKPAPAPVKVAAEVQRAPDAWRDHRGDHARLGQPFRLGAKPVAVDGPNVVIRLNKVDWSNMTTPSGKEIREGAASVEVTKGEEIVTGLIPQGEFKTIHGVRFANQGCGEEYNRQRMTYDPWVDLVATVAE